MATHKIVNHQDWLDARKQFLEKEKALTHQRDALNRERMALPWEKVEKRYVFENDAGQVDLDGLFGDGNQLLVYHFMFGPDYERGCKSCSFWADHFDAIRPHLRARGINLVAVSRGPLAKMRRQAEAQGWHFPWYSSAGSDFNYDFGASYRDGDIGHGVPVYNYGTEKIGGSEQPGVSAFFRDEGGIYHTYSAYSRGIDAMNAAYQYIDIAPLGRNEGDLGNGMAWVRHRMDYPGAEANA